MHLPLPFRVWPVSNVTQQRGGDASRNGGFAGRTLGDQLWVLLCYLAQGSQTQGSQTRGSQSSGLLLHGARWVPRGNTDESLVFGDYYYLEAINRFEAMAG